MREIVTLSVLFLFFCSFPHHMRAPFISEEPYNSIKHYIFQREGKMDFILDFVIKLTCLEIQHFFFSFCTLVIQFKGAPLGKLQGVYSDGISVHR